MNGEKRMRRIALMAFAVIAVITAGSPVAMKPASAEPVALTWVGGHGPNWSVAVNWSPARAPVNGDRLVFPSTLTPASVNDLNGLALAGIDISGDNVNLTGNPVALSGAVHGSATLPATFALPLVLRPGYHELSGDLTVTGAISGPGGLIFASASPDDPTPSLPTRLSGPNANTYTGNTSVARNVTLYLDKDPGVTAIPAGTLLITNDLKPIDVVDLAPNQVDDSTNIVIAGGGAYSRDFVVPETFPTLTPYETVKSVSVGFTGALDVGPPNVLAITSGLDVEAGGTLSIYADNGQAGQVQVASSPRFAAGSDFFLFAAGTAPPVGQPTVVIRNDSGAPIGGSFSNAPEGATVVFASRTPTPRPIDEGYRITYHGGDGNDVTLTRVDPEEQFVRAAYAFVLFRSVDDGGLQFWTDFLHGGGTRNSFTTTIASSDEGRRLAVQFAYQEVLGRSADPGGLDYWSQALLHGLPVDRFRSLLAGSSENAARTGHGTNRGYVDSLYRQSTILSRAPDPGGLDFWTGQLDGGSLTRSDVAAFFIDSDEAAHLNAGAVLRRLNRPTDQAAIDRLAATYRFLHADILLLTAVAIS